MTEELSEIYVKALAEVHSLGAIFEETLKKIEPDFSAQKFTALFEILLQHSLLEVASYDDKICKEELELIRKTACYGDIVGFSNTLGKGHIKWKDLMTADIASVRTWLAGMRKILEPMINDFSVKFAAFDAMVDGDSLANVLEGVSTLTAILSAVDGELNAEEAQSVSGTLIFDAFRAIRLLGSGIG